MRPLLITTIIFAGGLLTYLVARWLNNPFHLAKRSVDQFVPLKQHAFYKNLHNVIQDLTALCRKNPQLTQLYLLLGNFYRLRGETQRSVIIHQNILTDTNLPNRLAERTRVELGRDLFDLGMDEKAIETLKDIRDRSPFYVSAQNLLAEIHHHRNEYFLASEAMHRCLRKRRSAGHRTKAGYYLALDAQRLIADGDLPGAKKALSKALAADRGCVLAYLLKGDISQLEKEYDRAVSYYTELLHHKPQFTFMVVPKIEESYYAKQSFMQFGECLRELSRNAADDLFIHYSLGRHYRKKKMYKEAEAVLSEVLDRSPSYMPALEEMLALQQETVQTDEAEASTNRHEYVQNFMQELQERPRFRCSNCGHYDHRMRWRCNECGQWESFRAIFDWTRDTHTAPSKDKNGKVGYGFRSKRGAPHPYSVSSKTG